MLASPYFLHDERDGLLLEAADGTGENPKSRNFCNQPATDPVTNTGNKESQREKSSINADETHLIFDLISLLKRMSTMLAPNTRIMATFITWACEGRENATVGTNRRTCRH